MKKLLSSLLGFTLLASSGAARADDEDAGSAETPREAAPAATPKLAPPAKEEPPKRRVPTASLNFFWVPYGMNYVRAAIGLGATYKAPLVQRPGILWDTTNVTVGIRNQFGFVNNTAGAFVEVTPIAFFKLHVYAGYDVLFPGYFNGGLRILTPLARQRLAEGRIERGNRDALDWSDTNEAKDNRAIFEPPRLGGGLRVRAVPTLQGKIGPVGIQYNFTADFNFYRIDGSAQDDLFHDTFTFTVKKMRDVGFGHDVTVAYSVPDIPDEILAGVTGRYYYVPSTDIDNLALNALFFIRPRWRFFDERLSVFGAAQVGTNLIDPIYQYAFSWVLVVGADFKLF
ncbi:hypothetical protein [Polyangium aurulentum]|uniref:hypothetical protein n=1 Tax=Polyangium aurulentum TaxID=2567896 RepID=UPI0010AECE8E|nr:hypothetical protein [Polyangium aurulentum]UQA58847.1 hypothetical protein E8A73_047790 [Polyangium aurulentum]